MEKPNDIMDKDLPIITSPQESNVDKSNDTNMINKPKTITTLPKIDLPSNNDIIHNTSSMTYHIQNNDLMKQNYPSQIIQTAIPLDRIQSESIRAYSYYRMNQENINNSTNGIQIGKWETGLFSCFNYCVPNCLMSFFCPFIPLAQITARLGLHSYRTSLIYFISLFILFYIFDYLSIGFSMESNKNELYNKIDESSNIASSIFSWLNASIGIIIFISIFVLRSKIRELFKIKEKVYTDCCASFWCSCCVISQMATHTKIYKLSHSVFSAPDILPLNTIQNENINRV